MENELTQTNEFPDVPAELFRPADNRDITHDKALETKPVGYFKGAFLRFCKNKGAIVAAIIIAILILFAIIVPVCTPYEVSYRDAGFRSTLPKNPMFAGTDFWDGCQEKEMGEVDMIYYRAMGEETGHNAIKNQYYTKTDDGLYKFRLDSYYSYGCQYINVQYDEYLAIQQYQNETGIQVIYPTVRLKDRPQAVQDNTGSTAANYYFETKMVGGKTKPVLDKDGNVKPVYWTNPAGQNIDKYDSLRIEGDNYVKDGKTYQYQYARPMANSWELRVNYYEYFIFNHKVNLQDGIKEPLFLFGTTGTGQDILTCLASGARFSFIFAIAVAVVNLIVGAIYGSIEGYYGGKADMIMERVSDILSAVPMMIVITLLKYHLGTSSHVLVLFIAFFATGWIGMAGTTRMQFYRFKNQEYVLAARTLGASDFRLMFKHIFPNAIGTLVTSCALVIPSMIYSEVSLSYLGIINLAVGDITSVGTLINAGQAAITVAPHIALFPSIYLVLLMLCFNLFGNGLRDAFNPQLRGAEG